MAHARTRCLNDIDIILEPIYVSLVEHVYGRVNIRGRSIRFVFRFSDGARAVVDSANQSYNSVASLVTQVYSISVSTSQAVLYYNSDNQPVLCSHDCVRDASSFSTLLKNQSNLPPETLDRLKLWHLLAPSSCPEMTSVINSQLQIVKHQLSEVQERTQSLESTKRILEACLAHHQTVCPTTCKSTDDERACRNLRKHLTKQGWTVWTNTERNRQLLIVQYKLAIGQYDMREYCLQNVYKLDELADVLQFGPGQKILNTASGSHVCLYYSPMLDRLDFMEPDAVSDLYGE